MKRQEIFDKAITHLREQGAPSMSRTGCAYRGNYGRMCAIGIFISDEQYNEDLEGMSASSIGYALKGLCPGRNGRFLDDLQAVHDCDLESAYNSKGRKCKAVLEALERGAESFAKEWNLKYTPPS